MKARRTAAFVSDGYGNRRVVKFDRNGKFLATWGTEGAAPGQFDTPHSIATDRNRRVYVADRGNDRVQVFDEHGTYLDQWPNIIQPQTIRVSADNHVWVFAGSRLDKMLKYETDGQLLYAWGSHGTAPGYIWGVHGFSADSEGNLYTAEVFGGRAQKFRPKPGADSAKLYRAQPLMPKKAGTQATPRVTIPSAARARAVVDFSGAWELDQTDPPARAAGRGDQTAFGAVTPSAIIRQAASEVTIQAGSSIAAYNLDGTPRVAAPGDVTALKTWAHWDGSNLHLHYKKGQNWGRDVLTLKEGMLSILRDLESGGGSGTWTVFYRRAPKQ